MPTRWRAGCSGGTSARSGWSPTICTCAAPATRSRKRVGDDVTIVGDAVPTNPDVRQIFIEYNKYLLGRAADLDRHLEDPGMALLRSLLFALVFYGWTVVGGAARPSRSACSAPRRSAAGAYAWVRFHRWCARYILGIRTRVEGAPPEGAALVAGQAPVDVRDAGDRADARSAGDGAEARARRHSALGLGGAPLRRHPGRPVGRRRGAAADDARRRGGDRRGPADHHLSGRDAGARPARRRRSSRASPASTGR